MSCVATVILLGVSAIGADLPADFTLPPPPGMFIGAGSEAADSLTFRSKSPLAATSYFYWYDAPSKAHVINHDDTDALTDHPPTLEGFSYKNVDWHAQPIHGTGQWKEARFILPHARFAGRSNGADFRLAADGRDLVICHAAVRMLEK